MKPLKGTKNERGMSLVEVAIALAILGLIAVAFLAGLGTAAKIIFVADQRTTAESLARSQMEYLKVQPYSWAAAGGHGTYAKIDDSQIPEGYSVNSLDRGSSVVENIVGVPWYFPPDQPLPNLGYPVESDEGLQQVRVVIKHDDKELLTLGGLKVARR